MVHNDHLAGLGGRGRQLSETIRRGDVEGDQHLRFSRELRGRYE